MIMSNQPEFETHHLEVTADDVMAQISALYEQNEQETNAILAELVNSSEEFVATYKRELYKVFGRTAFLGLAVSLSLLYLSEKTGFVQGVFIDHQPINLNLVLAGLFLLVVADIFISSAIKVCFDAIESLDDASGPLSENREQINRKLKALDLPALSGPVIHDLASQVIKLNTETEFALFLPAEAETDSEDENDHFNNNDTAQARHLS
jgi:hypothetical protein